MMMQNLRTKETKEITIPPEKLENFSERPPFLVPLFRETDWLHAIEKKFGFLKKGGKEGSFDPIA